MPKVRNKTHKFRVNFPIFLKNNGWWNSSDENMKQKSTKLTITLGSWSQEARHYTLYRDHLTPTRNEQADQ